MSATVESPMPWRKTRLAANQVTPGTLFRSTSSTSNLSASASPSFTTRIQSPSSFGPHVDVSLLPTEACVDGTSPTAFILHPPSDKATPMGGLFSCIVRGGQNNSGNGSRFSTQLNKLSRQLQSDVLSPGLVTHGVFTQRLMSKSSDRLTDLPVCEPPASCSNKTGSLRIDYISKASWKPSASASDYSSVPPPQLTNGTESTGDSENSGVKSVRCQLVAGFLNIECSTLSPHDMTNHLQLLILDCRPFVSYNSNHIRGALNVSCSDCITRKRLLTGRACLGDLVSGTDDAKEQYRRAILSAQTVAGSVQVVVYDDDTEDFDALPAGHSLCLVVSCLRKAHIDVYYIYGGLKAFHKEFGNLCSRPGSPISRPLRGPTTPVAESCKIDNAKISQILPFLFIGNEHDAGDRTLLKRHGIGYVLNVTSHVPLHFESDGVTYVRYPAADSGTENLRQYFDDAIQFVDSVRERQGRVLIHCQAGVSRSSTIAIAYIMARSSLSMIDAFRFVKSRRSIVAPNFNFLGQLLDFESALKQEFVALRPDLDISDMIAAEYQPPPATPSLQLSMQCNDVDGMLE